MNILFIQNATGSRLYRILPIARYLARTKKYDCKVRGLTAGKAGGVSQTELDWADIVVMQMTFSPKFIGACKKAGCKIVYEIDDLMQSVGKKHYAYKEMNSWRTFLTYWAIWQSDVVTVTNQKLADTYKWFNPNIHVLPNYLDLPFWEKNQLTNTSKTIRLGWIGGNSHLEDLEFITPVIKRVLEKYPNVKFISTGMGGTPSPDPWVKFNYGESIFDDLPQEQYEYSLGFPMDVFPSKIPALRLDLAIAPVVQQKFSECKTPCKALEYGLNKIPGVYSKFLYKRHDTVIDGQTGFLVENNDDEWFDRICYLIDNEQERREMGERANKHIKENFTFEDHASKWEAIYKETCNITKAQLARESANIQTT